MTHLINMANLERMFYAMDEGMMRDRQSSDLDRHTRAYDTARDLLTHPELPRVVRAFTFDT